MTELKRRSIPGLLLFFVLVSPAYGATATGDRPTHFSFRDPSARSVAVAGSFNRWDKERDRLSGPDRQGRWTVSLRLRPGRYEYLFVVDNDRWVPDPAAPSVSDGMGGRNSVVVVEPAE